MAVAAKRGQKTIEFMGKVFTLDLAGTLAAFLTALALTGSVEKAAATAVSIFIPVAPSVAGFMGAGEFIAAIEATKWYKTHRSNIAIRLLAGGVEIALPLGLGVGSFIAGLAPINALNATTATAMSEQFFPTLGGALVMGKATELAIKKRTDTPLNAQQQLLVVLVQAAMILAGSITGSYLAEGDLTSNLPGAAAFTTILLGLWALGNFVLTPPNHLAVQGAFAPRSGSEELPELNQQLLPKGINAEN